MNYFRSSIIPIDEDTLNINKYGNIYYTGEIVALPTCASIYYNNSQSQLASDDIQFSVDELKEKLGDIMTLAYIKCGLNKNGEEDENE